MDEYFDFGVLINSLKPHKLESAAEKAHAFSEENHRTNHKL